MNYRDQVRVRALIARLRDEREQVAERAASRRGLESARWHGYAQAAEAYLEELEALLRGEPS